MNHRTTPDFWELYNALPHEVQDLADKNYALLQADSTHPSLRFKEIAGLWSVRVGAHYRALAYREDGDCVWFWIGTHAEYDKLMPWIGTKASFEFPIPGQFAAWGRPYIGGNAASRERGQQSLHPSA